MKKNNGLIWLIVSIVIIIFDQAIKYYMVTHYLLNIPVQRLPFLNFTLRYNPGAAFSFLGVENGWQIYFFSIIVVLVVLALLFWLYRLRRNQYILCLSISLIIGGGIGNLIDRLRLGYVIDFVDFHFASWHFATFNVADSAISVGAILLVLYLLFQKSTSHSQ